MVRELPVVELHWGAFQSLAEDGAGEVPHSIPEHPGNQAGGVRDGGIASGMGG